MQALSELLQTATSEIDAADDLAALDAVRVAYLGKKGELTARLKSLSALSADERPAAGQAINEAKQTLQGRINDRRSVRPHLKRSWPVTRLTLRCPVAATRWVVGTRYLGLWRALNGYFAMQASACVPVRRSKTISTTSPR